MKAIVEFKGGAIECEVAESFLKKLIGLSFTKRKKCMLFVFSKERSYPFSMRFMRYPLDFVFIDSHGKVVDLRRNVRKGIVRSRIPFLYAIELPAGKSEELEVSLGDYIKIEFLRNSQRGISSNL